jgi:hypothetical protein
MRRSTNTTDTRGDEHHDCPAGGDEAAQRLADQCTDPSTSPAERVEVGHDLLGAAHDVEQPQQRQAEQSPAEGQAGSAQALAFADQRSADGDEGDGHDVRPVSQPTVSTPRPSGPARSR